MNYSAVLFDMDGMLIDSELHWIRSEMAFLKEYNVELTKELNARLTGKSLRETVGIIKREFNLSASIEELMAAKKRHSDDIYEYHAQPMAGAVPLLNALKAQGVPMAIASGSSIERINKIISRFGWQQYFDLFASTDEVEAGKPDPAIYKYTADKLKIKYNECVVLEDSVNGVRSAKGAGMSCVAVPDERWSYGDFDEADLRVDSLMDKKLYQFLGLV